MSSSPSFRTRRRLSTLAETRCLATGEPRQLALAELADPANPVLPAPGDAEQETWEALVLTALMDHYGAHRPAETGGPYGIRRITPRAAELVVHVERSQLDQWARALVPVRRVDGTRTGLAGLRWTVQDKEVLLHPSGGTARLVLARTFARDWHRAVAATIHTGDTTATDDADQAAEERREHLQRKRIETCAATVSALMRRIMLLGPLAQEPFTGGSVEFQVTAGQLIDHSRNSVRLTPPWMVLHAPRALWPRSTAAASARSAASDVLAFMARYPQLPGVQLPTDAAQALCTLAGVAGSPAAHTAAAWALEVADQALTDPACGYLYEEGGWTANRRRALEGFVYDSGPLDPPGAGQLIELSPVTLTDLGRGRACLPTTGNSGPVSDDEEKLTRRGTQILLGLLDWALAAATHRPPDHNPWQKVTPTAASDEFPDQLPHARWDRPPAAARRTGPAATARGSALRGRRLPLLGPPRPRRSPALGSPRDPGDALQLGTLLPRSTGTGRARRRRGGSRCPTGPQQRPAPADPPPRTPRRRPTPHRSDRRCRATR
ncbi:hypothetical protein [Streptomyces sp. NPDC059460]|uniref:hypothetical protein n=1 Tax=Streptomyces sp. NPDC059460 TaxID=3346840 RepID=UPI0036C1A090